MSQIPWSIYENLKLLYGLLQGSRDEILMVSQDWLEASLYLTIWWDGEEDAPPDGSLNRSSMRKSGIQKPRPVDVSPLESYRDRLALEFADITHDPEDAVFAVQTLDPLQVGLGCVLENSVAAAIGMLSSFSVPVAVSVAEIASVGKWLPLARPKGDDGLLDLHGSKDDLLLLLSAGPGSQTNTQTIDRDEVLSDYAKLLLAREQVRDQEGWELAVAVLNRLDQRSDSDKQILEMLEQLDLDNEERVDKVLGVCDAFGLASQGQRISERFADRLAQKGESHGAALVYYARARASLKLKGHIEALTSMCLLHSAAMPCQDEMDTKLQSLLCRNRSGFKDLAATDLEAATVLSSYLSGYATLRQFYDLRDQEVYHAHGIRIEARLSSLQRRRQAAACLFAVIMSAADCIAGGLYDAQVESVVPVDGLLALFGETLPLLGQDTRILTEQQVFSLLSVVEDFVASPSRIGENAESLVRASITAHRDETSTASVMFPNRHGDANAGSSWDLMASMTAQHSQVGPIDRAWDWRHGLVVLGQDDTDRKALIGLFREALLNEVAQGWGGRLQWT